MLIESYIIVLLKLMSWWRTLNSTMSLWWTVHIVRLADEQVCHSDVPSRMSMKMLRSSWTDSNSDMGIATGVIRSRQWTRISPEYRRGKWHIFVQSSAPPILMVQAELSLGTPSTPWINHRMLSSQVALLMWTHESLTT